MKINLFWGLIQFEAGEVETVAIAIATGAVLVIMGLAYFISYNNVSLGTNPEHINCVEYEISHPSQYGSC